MPKLPNVLLPLTIILFQIIRLNAEYIPPGPLYRCPKEKLLLHPCTCDVESDQGIWVSCNNTNIASASLALNNLATFELPLERLTINTCHIGRLFGSLLYKLKVKVLIIKNTPLETIDEFSFLGVNNTLNELHVINSSLLEFPTGAFKLLGNLTVLNIDGQNLTDLPKDAFIESEMASKLLKLSIINGKLITPPIEALQPLRKLKTLDLHGNEMKDLKKNQFKGLRDVEVLDLSFNKIPKIDSSHLADLTKMSWLNVSHNNLKELTRGAFARNTVLKVLNMSFNQIKKLDSNSFRGMRFLRRLFLSDNLISDVGRGTFSTLQRIGTIDLARNFIKKVDYQMFFQLNFVELVDVSENQVTEVQKLAFKDLYLSTINLAKNNISKIEGGAFENCANMTMLDLSFNQIKELPRNTFDETTYATELQFSFNLFTSMEQIPLHNMTGIKILNVSHNLIETIPRKTFPKLYELHTIDLSYNNLSDIFNSVFQTLFSLRTLDLSHNSLESIKPSTFGALPTLLKLDMSYNKLENIARSGLTRLASTRELIIHHNKLHTLFQLPISTSHLDLSNNEFESIPPKLWPSMNSLLSLDLSFNKLGDNLESESFLNLLTLQRLNFSYNGMTRPPWIVISGLTSLQYLYMQGNNLTKLKRNAFGKMPVLFELDLSYNNINNVSSRAFEGLLQLIHLKMNNNNITVIPNGAFQGLVSLTNLDLSNNILIKLDNKTIGVFEDCLSLEKLDLSHNKITFITRKMFPSNPYIPYKLKEIDLSYNSIPVITYDLTFGTSKLENLNMSHNAIADIRKGVIGNLTKLKSLDLSYNKLYDLTSDPEFFRLPENVSRLVLAGNELKELPWMHLKNLSKLELLDIQENKMENMAQEVTELITGGTEVIYEGNPLHCDCFLRPLVRHFTTQLELRPAYKSIYCVTPPYLEGKALYTLSEEKLTCPSNVNTTKLMDKLNGDFDVLSDLRFRELNTLASTRELIIHHNKLHTLFQLPISTSHLDLSNNEFESIPPKLWPSMNSLLSLDLSFNKLGDNLESESFLNLLTLQRLNFSYNGMTRPPWIVISGLTSLQYLYMQGNNLTKLKRNAFGKMPVLFELDLSYNNINNVSSRAFEGLLQLIHLKMNNNNITVIPNGAFQGLVSLTNLDLSNNILIKLDNKTIGVFEDCLSLEKLDLSHNKITFITRKMFPSNPYIPYKLKEIDLSYNSIPVITYDLTFGTSKLENLNMSHNAIADIRKGVIGNLTKLKSLDLSYNKLYDLTSDPEFFRLPENVSRLVLAGNELKELPWMHLKNLSKLELLDIQENKMENMAQEVTELITGGTEVIYEGNPLHCDCFLRPLVRHFTTQLELRPAYKSIYCVTPPYLEGKALYTLSEEKLTCPSNVNTTKLMDKLNGDFDVLSDLRFRELNTKKNILKVKWRVMKQDDIADTAIFIRDVKNPVDIIFQTTLPYFKRVLEIDVKEKLKTKEDLERSYQICILSKTSKNSVRKFYPEQCRDLSKSLVGSSNSFKLNKALFISVLILLLFRIS